MMDDDGNDDDIQAAVGSAFFALVFIVDAYTVDTTAPPSPRTVLEEAPAVSFTASEIVEDFDVETLDDLGAGALTITPSPPLSAFSMRLGSPRDPCVNRELNLRTFFIGLKEAGLIGSGSSAMRKVIPSLHGGVVKDPEYCLRGVVSRCLMMAVMSSGPVSVMEPGSEILLTSFASSLIKGVLSSDTSKRRPRTTKLPSTSIHQSLLSSRGNQDLPADW